MLTQLFTAASTALTSLNLCIEGLPAPQVTVLYSCKGKLYIAENDVAGAICEKLQENEDTQIVTMLTMWKGECVDVASYAFRKALLALNSHNAMTDVILQGRDGYITKKLGVTL